MMNKIHIHHYIKRKKKLDEMAILFLHFEEISGYKILFYILSD